MFGEHRIHIDKTYDINCVKRGSSDSMRLLGSVVYTGLPNKQT